MNKLVRNAILMAISATAMLTAALILQARADNTPQPLTIGIVLKHDKLAACSDVDVATNVAKLHVEKGYAAASQYFQMHLALGICGVIQGDIYPYSVVYHGYPKDGTIVKIVDVSGMKDDTTPDVGKHFYVVTQRPVVGSGIKEPVAGTDS